MSRQAIDVGLWRRSARAWHVPGLEFQGDKPMERRSLPPARRSPGPRSRDAGNNLQMAQMMEMMKAMTHQLQEVKAQVGKLQQDRDPFPFMPVVSHDDDDEDDGGQ